jgi:nitroreductase
VTDAIDPDSMSVHGARCISCGHCYAICPVDAVDFAGLTAPETGPVPDSLAGDLEELIQNRRSVRQFSDRPVEPGLLSRILDAADYSPTGTNARKTGVIALSRRSDIDQLNGIIMRRFTALARILINPLTRPILRLVLGRETSARVFSYSSRIGEYWQGRDILTHDAPVLLIFYGDRRAPTASQDGMIRAANTMLLAEAHGLGSCYIGFLVIGIRLSPRARRFLGLQRGRRVFETMILGHPRVRYLRGVPRFGGDIRFFT